MSRRTISKGNNAFLIPDEVGLRLGEYTTLPTCNAQRKNHIGVNGTTLYLCDGSTWGAVATLAGSPTFSGLAGTGTRVVTASSTGLLGTSVLTPGTLLIAQDSDYTASNVNTAQQVFNESPNGAATVVASTTYILDAVYMIDLTGVISRTMAIGFGGTATITSIHLTSMVNFPATDIAGTPFMNRHSAGTSKGITNAIATAAFYTITLTGIVRVNAVGTLIPQFTMSAAPGGVTTVRTNSYLRLTPFGSNLATTVGVWS